MPGRTNAPNGIISKKVMSVILLLVFSVILSSGMISCKSIKNINLTKECKDALRTNPNIDETKLVCNVKDGVAYVSGTVYTQAEKELVTKILSEIEGITDVRSTITIEEGGETNPTMLWF